MLQFRNVEASPDDDVRTWPYEALVTAIDRGLVADWQPIFAAIGQSPWGPVARSIEHYLTYREPDGVSTLFGLAIGRARSRAERDERLEVAARVADAIDRSGLTNAEFARLVGTSASRLSTYRTGRVVPSATMLLRIERCGAQTLYRTWCLRMNDRLPPLPLKSVVFSRQARLGSLCWLRLLL